jgi:CBS domain containing-hemolysin-like protein
MVDPTFFAAAVATVALLGLSAFFSSSEIAVFSLPADWLAERAAAGDERAELLRELQTNPHRLLVTLLVGNNVVNVAISSIVSVGFASALPPGQAVVAATVFTSSVVLIFGEIVPKSYGLGNAQSWALRVARPVRLVELALYPLVSVFDLLTGFIGDAIGGQEDIEQPYVDD